MDRLDLYLHDGSDGYYCNTTHENELVTKFSELYYRALSAKNSDPEVSEERISMYRRAYNAELGALDTKTGKENKNKKLRQLRNLVYELIESKVDNSIPMPKMVARYKTDKYLVDTTESYIKYNMDTLLAKYINDAAERSTYIDGTSWFKVVWNSMDSTHERSGSVGIEHLTVDQVVPQPGIKDYRKLEYIFEISYVSTTRLYDLYQRIIPADNDEGNMVKVVNCYYLNENHIVGLFSWAYHSNLVICDEHDWQIRKLRYCKQCGAIQPTQTVCGNCGGKRFEYRTAEKEILAEDLYEVINPYEAGLPADKNAAPIRQIFAKQGTEIPFYMVRQLPFVPRPAISRLNSIYGASEVKMILEEQDAANKLLTKSLDKILKSGTVITKPEKIKLGDLDDTVKQLPVRSPEEAQMVQAKQLISDTTQDIVISNLLYESARSTSGVTESFQGKSDSTAVSGKAKMYAAAQSAGRIQSLREMKAAAFAGLYELVLKYELAFSDEPVRFVKKLPNGDEVELEWNKYMFLAKDKYGEIYYRDDFKFNTDAASTLSQDRAAMWQETSDKFIQGALGNIADPRTVELYWNIMGMFEYPLANVALAGIKSNSKHLPPAIEKALLDQPELLQSLMASIEQGTDQRGGARPNSGPEGNGATHADNVERTNERNRAANKEVVGSAQTGGVL